MLKVFKNTFPFPTYLANKFWLFPDGGVGVRFEKNYRFEELSHPINIVARIQNSNDIMELILAEDALNRMGLGQPINLYLFCVPYQRQDRVCTFGESFSIVPFARIINSLRFNSITIADPHSYVTPALFDNCKVITQIDIISKFESLNKFVLQNQITIVAPDYGAAKKTEAICQYFNNGNYIQAKKVRDLATGKILDIEFNCDDLKGCKCLIFDDLCDAGGTFIGLAQKLKKLGAEKVFLYVTHGLFTKGTDNLYDNGIDAIFTTNSFYETWPGGVDIPVENILDLEKTFIK